MRLIAGFQIALVALFSFETVARADAAKASCQALIEHVSITRHTLRSDGEIAVKRFALILRTAQPASLKVALEVLSGTTRHSAHIAIDTAFRDEDPYATSAFTFVELPAPISVDSIRIAEASLDAGASKSCSNNDYVVYVPSKDDDKNVSLFPDRRSELRAKMAQDGDASATPIRAVRTADIAAAQCAQPNIASTALKIVRPKAPDFYHQRFPLGESVIRILLDADGTILSGDIVKSSGNAAVDAATVAAAMKSTYTPQIFRCHPIASEGYLRSGVWIEQK